MSKKGIRMSPKYGVNPGMETCFFCGETKGVIMYGRIGDGRKHEDFEAPKYATLNYEPCDKCKEKFSKGVLIMEVADHPKNEKQPSINKDQKAYPTGRHVVIKPEALNNGAKAGDKGLMWSNEFEQMFGEALKETKDDSN